MFVLFAEIDHYLILAVDDFSMMNEGRNVLFVDFESFDKLYDGRL